MDLSFIDSSAFSINWESFGDPEIIGRLILQVFLFIASATFSMSETSLFSLRESDFDKISSANRRQADRVRALLDEPRQLIVSILCGNELINIAATINLAGILLIIFGSPEAAGIANTLIMLPLLLILGELTPKTLAVTKPAAMTSAIVEPVISIWVRLVAPLRYIVRLISDQITTLLIGEARTDQSILAPDEFRVFLKEVEKDGVVNVAERRLITNLIDAAGTRAVEIMVPRPQVKFIDAGTPVPEIIDIFRHLRHRRVPVFRTSRDNVIGMIKEDRLLSVVTTKPVDSITLEDLLEPATLVPTTVIIGELAEFFKRGDHHAVILINEFGGVEGLVSADDVFGYLTRGRSLHLDPYASIERSEDGFFTCAGLTPIRSLREVTGVPFEADGVITVGGLIMSQLGRVPTVDDEAIEMGMIFRVLEADHLLVQRVMVAEEGHASLMRENAGVQA